MKDLVRPVLDPACFPSRKALFETGTAPSCILALSAASCRLYFFRRIVLCFAASNCPSALFAAAIRDAALSQSAPHPALEIGQYFPCSLRRFRLCQQPFQSRKRLLYRLFRSDRKRVVVPACRRSSLQSHLSSFCAVCLVSGYPRRAKHDPG